MSNHKQASLHKATHKLISEIAKVMQDKPDTIGKVSKADVVHSAVLSMHKKVVKSGNKQS